MPCHQISTVQVGGNGEWKASKWVLTRTRSGWKRRGHQTGPCFLKPPPRTGASTRFTDPLLCKKVKTRTGDYTPKAARFIISSVLSVPPPRLVSQHGITPKWSHQVGHPPTWRIKARQREMCRPFWLHQSRRHAERLLIKSWGWHRAALSPQPEQVPLPASCEQSGAAEGGEVRGRWRRWESRAKKQGEEEEEEGERRREETRRRISLGFGRGR